MIVWVKARLSNLRKPRKTEQAWLQNFLLTALEAEVMGNLFIKIWHQQIVSCFVCWRQTIVWWNQTLVCPKHTIVWSEQTIERIRLYSAIRAGGCQKSYRTTTWGQQRAFLLAPFPEQDDTKRAIDGSGLHDQEAQAKPQKVSETDYLER